MTLLGKCFTVIIFLLSLTFMVLALAVNASHRNWRDLVLGKAGYKEQIEAISRQNEQLRDATQRAQASLNREQVARRTALASLQTQLDQLKSELALRTNAYTTLNAKNQTLTQLDEIRATELKSLTDTNEKLRGQVRQEQEDRDELFAQTLVLTDKLNSLRGVVQEFDTRNQSLLAEITRFREVADHHGIDVNAPLDGAPPDRNGVVLVVNRQRALAEVSIGSDDGLRNGDHLEVSRGRRYIGRLKILRTEPNRAVGEIMPDYREGIMQEGDRVDTSIE
ncbi:MAG: hypothetical protein AAFX06_27775 [Planctomycetota bacterium]